MHGSGISGDTFRPAKGDLSSHGGRSAPRRGAADAPHALPPHPVAAASSRTASAHSSVAAASTVSVVDSTDSSAARSISTKPDVDAERGGATATAGTNGGSNIGGGDGTRRLPLAEKMTRARAQVIATSGTASASAAGSRSGADTGHLILTERMMQARAHALATTGTATADSAIGVAAAAPTMSAANSSGSIVALTVELSSVEKELLKLNFHGLSDSEVKGWLLRLGYASGKLDWMQQKTNVSC